MATDLERLVVRLEAQMRTFEREMVRGRQTADKETKAIENRFKRTNQNIANSMNETTALLRRGFGALGIGLSGRELIQFADQFTQIQNALKVTGLEGKELDRVYQSLYASAQKNAAPLTALATLYGRAALVQKELKISTQDLLTFTDRVALALRVSGQSAEQSSGALLQLSQALGSGVVRAEEFNSILEGALPIAQAAARGIADAGGSVAKLRQLIVDGKVSSEAFFRGFMIGSADLQRQAASMDLTIGQATEKLKNAMIDTVGRLNTMSGASSGAVSALDLVARAVRGIGEAAGWASAPLEKLKKQIEDTPDLKKYLLAPLLPLIQALETLAAAGEKVDQKTKQGWLNEERLAEVNAELDRLKAKIADAMNPELQGRAVELDRQRLEIIRQRVAELELERQALNKLVNTQGPQLPSPSTPSSAGGKPINLADYPVTGKKKDKLDTFERSLISAQKRIDILTMETRLIDQNSAAVERARLVIDLETAARAKNQAEGKKNIEVTKEQRVQIEAMADQMYRAADAAEKARSPLLEFSREAKRVNDRYQEFALGGVRAFEDALVSLGDRTETVAEKFKKMTASILQDLSRLLIRQTITAPLAGWLGGMFTGGGTGPNGAIPNPNAWAGLLPGRAVGGPVTAGQPYMVGERGREMFVPSQDGVIIPNHALRSSSGGSAAITYAPVYNFQGTSEELAQFRAEAARDRAQFSAKVIATVRQANRSNVKLN